MAGIASKNLYDLLGNDPEQDPDREPEPPTKAIDKPVARTGKRTGPSEAPAKAAGSQGGRPARDSHNANENAFRDSGVGADKNRTRGTGEEGGYRGRGEGRGRGSRGARGGRGAPRGAGGDRHSRTGISEHEKQAAHGWGGATGTEEFNDEKAGEAIAKAEEAEEGAIANEPDSIKEAAEPEPEPEEDKTKSYTDYLAELAEKKLSLSAAEIRKPNEGNSKKFPEGKPITRQEEEDFMAGSGGKAKRERERKQKEVVQLDDSRINQGARDSLGRGGGRGGRGRGEFRGGEGRGRGGRGRGEGRGRGGGERGSRGGQSGSGGPNVLDSSAFPSLGS